MLIPVDLFSGENAAEVDFIIGDNTGGVVRLGLGDDHIDAKGGRDIVYGGADDDVILGGTGRDRLHGGADDDLLKGEGGNDLLFGNAGDDILHGGAGRDVLVAGGDQDVFVFERDGDYDLVLGFRANFDKIDLTAFDFEESDLDHVVTKTFLGARLDLDGTTVTLLGVNAHRLDADDFIL